jgi:hypothetical protein
MRRLTDGLFISAAILIAGCLVTGCGTSGSGPLASFSPTRNASRSASLPASPGASLAPTSGASSVPGASISATAAVPPSVPPATITPSPAEQPGTSAAPSADSGSSVIWLWVLLGAVVLVGGLAWMAARRRARRSAAGASRQSEIVDAYSKGSALHDAMSAAETPGALAAEDAGTRWLDIQRRADDLTQTLYAMRAAAPDEDSRARVANALALLQAVRSAMEAERAPGGAGPQAAETVRSRLFSFEASLRALRAEGEPVR